MTDRQRSLPERKRVEAMRRVQRVALDAFAAEGFHAVTVERVAAGSGVSPVSVYRWFGTKEGIVLWDDYDPAIFEAIAARLPTQPPLAAFRDGVVAELSRVYDADRDLVLARTQLIHTEPALLAASMLGVRTMTAALAELLIDVVEDQLHRMVLAGTATAVLTAAIDRWQAQDGRTPLAELIRDAFAALEGPRWS